MTTAVAKPAKGAEKKPDAKSAEDAPYTNKLLVSIDPKKPKEGPKKVEIKLIHRAKDTQQRADTSPSEVVDTFRVEQFAAAVKAGAKFPPVKLMVCNDVPKHKDEPLYVLWDGFHTVEGHERAGKTHVEAVIWHGTWAQAMAAAAEFANVEHVNGGKPPAFKDKIRSLHLYVKALENAGVPAKDMPSNRQLGEKFGVSRQTVNDEDPCGRRKEGSKTKEDNLTRKRTHNEAVAAGKAHLEGGAAAGKTYDIVRRATNELVGTFAADSAAAALEAYSKKSPGARASDFLIREMEGAAPKAGAEKAAGFDFQMMESDIGRLSRGLDSMGDLFGCKGTSEFKQMHGSLNNFLALFTEVRKKYGKKKPEPKAEAKAAEPKAHAPAEAK